MKPLILFSLALLSMTSFANSDPSTVDIATLNSDLAVARTGGKSKGVEASVERLRRTLSSVPGMEAFAKMNNAELEKAAPNIQVAGMDNCHYRISRVGTHYVTILAEGTTSWANATDKVCELSNHLGSSHTLKIEMTGVH